MAVIFSSPSNAERSDGKLARIWKALVRQEWRLARWMATNGVPSSLVTALLWLLKIALIVLVGYALFWLAIVLAIAFLVLKILGRAAPDPEPYAWEWRQGPLGLGVYDKSGQRVDPHDPTAND